MSSTSNSSEPKRFPSFSQSKLEMPTKTLESIPSSCGNLQPHQDELQQLGELAGIHMGSKVFRILVEFLNMGVDPNTIFTVLKSIRRASARHSRSALSTHS